jgi:hypothetical protein
MNIWFLTVGNSDIAFTDTNTWHESGGFDATSAYSMCCDANWPTETKRNSKKYTAPARVTGEIYRKLFEDTDEELREIAINELKFPLIDSYFEWFNNNEETVDIVYVFLSDQKDVFSEGDRVEDCPYWKDTCELWPMLEYRLKSGFPNAEIIPITLAPKSSESGLDHWDKTLTRIQTEIVDLKLSNPDKVFVSHQAGTPAMSSALQFVTLASFGDRVEFLVGNEYQENSVEPVPSSKYLRGIQIEQAKQLIQAGEPSAALTIGIKDIDSTITKDLELVRDRMNLRETYQKGESQEKVRKQEFETAHVAKRIDDALDISEILLDKGKYALAITLLTATHETFLKAALRHVITPENVKGCEIIYRDRGQDRCLKFDGSDVRLSWKNSGFWIQSCGQSVKAQNNNLLKILKYVPQGKKIGWELLEFIGKYDRAREADLRNQFMHNLRGVTERDAIGYLIGAYLSDDEDKANGLIDQVEQYGVVKVYRRYVQQRFRDALCDVGLRDGDRTENVIQIELERLAERLT